MNYCVTRSEHSNGCGRWSASLVELIKGDELVKAVDGVYHLFPAKKNLAVHNVCGGKFSITNISGGKLFALPTQHQAQIKIITKLADFEHPSCND